MHIYLTFITFRVHLFFVRCSRGEHERPAQMQAIVLDEAWPAMAFGWPMVSLEEESEWSREREAGATRLWPSLFVVCCVG